MTGTLEVLEPGFLTTVQDLGRHGFQHLGFGVGGAADARSHRFANYLVGNPGELATLESTIRGPRVRFNERTTVAVVGAEPVLTVNGAREDAHRSVAVGVGDELAIDGMNGARSYLAVRGGIDVPRFLDSRSTDLVAGIGGLEGRALRAGDTVPYAGGAAQTVVQLRTAFWPVALPRLRLEITFGPQYGCFERDEVDTLVGSVYSVTSESNRMGIRLYGPPIKGSGREVLSEGQPEGAVQIPHGGLPIILLAGRQTIGGYPKIGVVGRRGLSDLGQALPGTEVTFEWLTPAELASDTRRWLATIGDPTAVTKPLS